jgi:hypothetical protein
MIPSPCKPKAPRAQQRPNYSGKSTTNMLKLALNKAVEAGTFKQDKCKWATFKSKIMAIDPQSEENEVNPRHAWDVLHVKCSKFIHMAMVYDTTLYKRHVQSCKSRTANTGMHTLDNGLNYVSLPLSGSSSANKSTCNKLTTLWPCPGLSEKDKPRIENYLHWTTVSSSGGISINTIAGQMYKTPYKELEDDQKQAVRVGQLHTHQWSRDHQRRRVFAIGEERCSQKVPHNPGWPQPCCACKALLRNRAFQTAINRDIPDDENRKFTPHLYQAAEIAKICTRHSGLGPIFDKVGSG